ncbi:HAMP domain-containing sensor histidine kinase [Paenibacillus sp. HB172176]|uniref:sensor histidine kinase n=1 Tax=Paenibacillus sp. HB172176 TaxID=2493690 RepID=UPI00143C3F18|nr:HAMP domain-containing sensor histidine kinase [Paenibacillus sp. HB172176]
MLNTLYLRVVLTFLLAVFVSLTVSFFITYNIFEKQVLQEIEEELISSGKQVIQLAQSVEPEEAYSFFRGVFNIRSRAAIFKEDGTVTVYGDADPESFASAEEVQRVLQGGVQRFDFTKRGLQKATVVGIPFELDGQSHALFLKPNIRTAINRVKESLMTGFLLVLIMGSLLFLAATYFLVSPIKRLTKLTARIAKGQFDQKVPDKRRDEIGELARSFNRMSGELNQLENMRKEFISNVSHDIQSPLTSIRGFAAALRDNPHTEERRARYLTIIEEESTRLAKLSENLLKLAVLESNQITFVPTSYDPAKHIRKVFLTLQPLWLEKSIAIDLEGLHPYSIQADASQMEQVWHNVISNSIKFTPPGGEIRVSSSENRHSIRLDFSDTGEGIREEDLPHVFSRFYKSDKARDREHKGSGLGLAIVKQIVQMHKGTVEISSEWKRGTTVSIVLPKLDSDGLFSP